MADACFKAKRIPSGILFLCLIYVCNNRTFTSEAAIGWVNSSCILGKVIYHIGRGKEPTCLLTDAC